MDSPEADTRFTAYNRSEVLHPGRMNLLTIRGVDHAHPEHRLVADFDVTDPFEGQLSIIADAEHRRAGRNCAHSVRFADIHRLIVLDDHQATTGIDVERARVYFSRVR